MDRIDDELIDEFGDTITRIGRFMSTRYSGSESCREVMSMAQAMLARFLDHNGPSKMSDVAAMLGIKPPAASAAVDALEREGFVTRTHDPDDRRVTLVSLTDTGREALEAIESVARMEMRRYLEILPVEDVRHLVRIHRDILAAMSEGRV